MCANPPPVTTLEDLFEFESALVVGIGGSGDVVGSVPTARLLESQGIDVLLGGATWEPVPYDDRAGPRSLEKVENADRVSETVALAGPETRTRDGLRFKEAIVAEELSTDIALIDVSNGSKALVTGLEAACDRLEIDVVVGVDVGSDVLAAGDESGLRSPVVDGLGLVALDEIDVPSCLGVFGYGSDGELSRNELEARISRIAERDGLLGAWGITPRVTDELEEILEAVETTASRLPVEAARGELGARTIRGGDISIRLTPPSVVTFYFDPGVVASTSTVADLLRETTSLEEAVENVTNAGLGTEFQIERERLEGGNNRR